MASSPPPSRSRRGRADAEDDYDYKRFVFYHPNPRSIRATSSQLPDARTIDDTLRIILEKPATRYVCGECMQFNFADFFIPRTRTGLSLDTALVDFCYQCRHNRNIAVRVENWGFKPGDALPEYLQLDSLTHDADDLFTYQTRARVLGIVVADVDLKCIFGHISQHPFHSAAFSKWRSEIDSLTQKRSRIQRRILLGLDKRDPQERPAVNSSDEPQKSDNAFKAHLQDMAKNHTELPQMTEAAVQRLRELESNPAKGMLELLEFGIDITAESQEEWSIDGEGSIDGAGPIDGEGSIDGENSMDGEGSTDGEGLHSSPGDGQGAPKDEYLGSSTSNIGLPHAASQSDGSVPGSLTHLVASHSTDRSDPHTRLQSNQNEVVDVAVERWAPPIGPGPNYHVSRAESSGAGAPTPSNHFAEQPRVHHVVSTPSPPDPHTLSSQASDRLLSMLPSGEPPSVQDETKTGKVNGTPELHQVGHKQLETSNVPQATTTSSHLGHSHAAAISAHSIDQAAYTSLDQVSSPPTDQVVAHGFRQPQQASHSVVTLQQGPASEQPPYPTVSPVEASNLPNSTAHVNSADPFNGSWQYYPYSSLGGTSYPMDLEQADERQHTLENQSSAHEADHRASWYDDLDVLADNTVPDQAASNDATSSDTFQLPHAYHNSAVLANAAPHHVDSHWPSADSNGNDLESTTSFQYGHYQMQNEVGQLRAGTALSDGYVHGGALMSHVGSFPAYGRDGDHYEAVHQPMMQGPMASEDTLSRPSRVVPFGNDTSLNQYQSTVSTSNLDPALFQAEPETTMEGTASHGLEQAHRDHRSKVNTPRFRHPAQRPRAAAKIQRPSVLRRRARYVEARRISQMKRNLAVFAREREDDMDLLTTHMGAMDPVGDRAYDPLQPSRGMEAIKHAWDVEARRNESRVPNEAASHAPSHTDTQPAVPGSISTEHSASQAEVAPSQLPEAAMDPSKLVKMMSMVNLTANIPIKAPLVTAAATDLGLQKDTISCMRSHFDRAIDALDGIAIATSRSARGINKNNHDRSLAKRAFTDRITKKQTHKTSLTPSAKSHFAKAAKAAKARFHDPRFSLASDADDDFREMTEQKAKGAEDKVLRLFDIKIDDDTGISRQGDKQREKESLAEDTMRSETVEVPDYELEWRVFQAKFL